jgi:hypothetical protein
VKPATDAATRVAAADTEWGGSIVARNNPLLFVRFFVGVVAGVAIME